MSRAEERGLEAVPPRWRKTKDGKGKVDSAWPVRKFYIRAYEQAEKDLALTWQDIQAIIKIVLTRPALDDYPPSEKFCKSVLEEFNKTRK